VDISLFDEEQAPIPTNGECKGQAVQSAPPRYQRPNRAQVELRACDLEALIAEDHPVRTVWAFVEGIDLSPLYQGIRAVEGGAGRPPIDPAILMALWLYATLEGVGSARTLERLCHQHDAYRWLCGGVSVNYHTLADFRVAHGAFLDHRLTVSVATLMSEGLVTMKRVAQDGVRIGGCLLPSPTHPGELSWRGPRTGRSAAPRASRRSGSDLQARESRAPAGRPRTPTAGAEGPGAGTSGRSQEEGGGEGQGAGLHHRPEARVMKMADGGFRPAFT
jgi:transposase